MSQHIIVTGDEDCGSGIAERRHLLFRDYLRTHEKDRKTEDVTEGLVAVIPVY